MSIKTISPQAEKVERLLEGPSPSPLTEFLKREGSSAIETRGYPASIYDLFVVRRNQDVGSEIYGPTTLHVGQYDEAALYGAAGSPVIRFRIAVRKLAKTAEQIARLDPLEVEYAHQVSLFWSEVGQLKEFLGCSEAITEIVSELRTARFQFIGVDTSRDALQAMAKAFAFLAKWPQFTQSIVDDFAEMLENGGIDSFAVEDGRRKGP